MIEEYKSLIDEMEILVIRIDGLEKEKEFILRKLKRGPGDISSIAYDGMPKGNAEHKSLARYVEDIQRIDNLIYIDTEILKIKKETLKKLEAKFDSMPGINKQVAYLAAKGKKLNEIAKILGCSYQHVRRIHSKL